jgi:hypothetical protein
MILKKLFQSGIREAAPKTFPKRAAVVDVNHPPDLTVVGVLLPQSQFFYCVDCAKEACRVEPALNHEILFHCDIYPQSQACHQCYAEAVQGEPGMSEKFWRPAVSDQSLQLLFQELDNLSHVKIDSVEETLCGIVPPRDQAITLVSIVDFDFDDTPTSPNLDVVELHHNAYDDDEDEPTRPCIRTTALLAACM